MNSRPGWAEVTLPTEVSTAGSPGCFSASLIKRHSLRKTARSMDRGESKLCGMGRKEPPSLGGVLQRQRWASSASEGLRAVNEPQGKHDHFCTRKFMDPLIVILSKKSPAAILCNRQNMLGAHSTCLEFIFSVYRDSLNCHKDACSVRGQCIHPALIAVELPSPSLAPLGRPDLAHLLDSLFFWKQHLDFFWEDSSCVGQFYANFTRAKVIWEEGASIKKMVP